MMKQAVNPASTRRADERSIVDGAPCASDDVK